MRAFIDTPITKERFIHHLKWHQKQDAFLAGTYSENEDQEIEKFKGCAVGCSLHSVAMELGDFDIDYSKHVLYEEYLGVPEWLARVEDTIFEGLDENRRKQWPIEFGEAINEGAHLDSIKAPFLVYLLESCLKHIEEPQFKEQKQAVERVIELYKNDEKDQLKLEEAAKTAEVARATRVAMTSWPARAAAWAAARAAWALRATRPTAMVTRIAARIIAAGAGVTVAIRLADYQEPEEAAKAVVYNHFADKLLELIRDCK